MADALTAIPQASIAAANASNGTVAGQQALGGGGLTSSFLNSPNSSTTINSGSLAPTSSINFPPAPTYSTPSVADIFAQYSSSPETTAAQGQVNDTLASLKDLETKYGGQSAEQTNLEAQAGLPDLTKASTDLQDLITSTTAQANQAKLGVQGTPGLTSFQDAQTQQIDRAASTRLLGYSASLDALNGKIANANDKVARALANEFNPIQAQIDYQKTLLQQNNSDLTKAEQKLATQQQAALTERQNQLDQQKADKTQVYNIITTAASNGQTIPANIIQQALSSDTGTALNLLQPYMKAPNSYSTITSGGSTYQVQKDASGKIIGSPQLVLSDPTAGALGGNDTTPVSTHQTYALKAGDDPFNIAQQNGLDMATLQKLNPQVTDWHNLPVGYQLNLPLAAGALSTNPTVDGWAQGILNGSVAGVQSVPKQYQAAVNDALNTPSANGYTPLASRRFTMAANSIVANYIALPQYQLTANGLPYLQRIAAAEQNPGSVSDQDLLDSLTKLNTSGNAISDAQVKLITGGRSFTDSASVWLNKLGSGGTLSTSQRAQIQKIATAIYANYKSGYQPVYDQATAQLKASGIPQAFWTIPDLNKLNTQTTAPLQSGSTGTLSSGLTFTIQ